MSNCIDPFKYFIDYAEWFITSNPSSTFSDVLNQLNVFPYSSDICCPDCGSVGSSGDNIYILSGNFDTEELSNFFLYFVGRTTAPSCCLNTHVSSVVYSDIVSNLLETYPNTYGFAGCCTNHDIETCITQLSEFLQSSEFNQYIIDWANNGTGIAEFNTINSNSLFCKVYEGFPEYLIP